MGTFLYAGDNDVRKVIRPAAYRNVPIRGRKAKPSGRFPAAYRNIPIRGRKAKPSGRFPAAYRNVPIRGRKDRP